MLQRLGAVRIIFMTTRLCASALAVELHANEVILTEAPGDTVDGGSHLIAAFASAIAAAMATTLTAVVLLKPGESRSLLSRVLLENLLVARPNVLQSFFNGFPIVRPFKFAHLPRVVDFLIRFEDNLMIKVERHVILNQFFYLMQVFRLLVI